mmetsp:Transcript_11359/g.26354  ORF Transcript_11359/g.26354 Transcript_11359/m.26354 type:complete len:104 (+) Transcript_11359:3416-3727(+)
MFRIRVFALLAFTWTDDTVFTEFSLRCALRLCFPMSLLNEFSIILSIVGWSAGVDCVNVVCNGPPRLEIRCIILSKGLFGESEADAATWDRVERLNTNKSSIQ